MAAASIDIRRTDDRRAAVALGIAAGLDERGPGDVDVAAMWGAYDGDSLVGTVSLGTLHGLTVVSWLAVDEAYRGRGLGRLLLGELEAEVRRRGVREVWAPVRAPEFFKAVGYEESERARSATRSSPTVSTAAASAAPAVRRSSSSAGRDGP